MLLNIMQVKAQQRDSSDYMPAPPSESGVSSVLRSQRHVLFIDITENSWAHLPAGIETNFISGGVNLSLFYDFFYAHKHFSIAPGLSFSNATVKTNGYTITNDSGSLSFVELIPYPAGISYIKNKLSISYFDVPVEFRFQVHPDERGKNFWISPGFRAGILLSDFWKYKYEAGGMLSKTKTYYQQDLQKYHYGVSLRAGYYKVGVFAYYSLSTLFEKDRGPDLIPFSIGIAFTPL